MNPLPILLFLIATAPADTGVRTLPVRLVVEAGFRAQPQWRGVATQVLEQGAAHWDTLAGLRFRVAEEIPWTAPDPEAALESILGDARAAAGDHEGLTLVLVARRTERRGRDFSGYATLLRPFVILENAAVPAMALTLRHELGHVFGLPHLPGRSVMAEKAEDRTWGFDPIEQDVLRATRGMRFNARSPFTGCRLEVVRDAYLFWAERGVGRASLLLNLGVAFRRQGSAVDARRCLEAAMAMDRDLGPGWFHLGRACQTLGDAACARSALERYLAIEPAGRLAPLARVSLERLGLE
jgi:hypothetical protein